MTEEINYSWSVTHGPTLMFEPLTWPDGVRGIELNKKRVDLLTWIYHEIKVDIETKLKHLMTVVIINLVRL